MSVFDHNDEFFRSKFHSDAYRQMELIKSVSDVILGKAKME
jgi:hypothetical protein